MNVADVMTPREDVVMVEVPGTRDDVLEYLQDRAFSSVPVVSTTEDGEEFRGLVTRDALIEQPDEDQLALLVEEVPTTSADTDIHDLAEQMHREDARRVPVVDGQFEGIVTITDVVRSIATGNADGDTDVGGLATDEVNSTFAGAPLPVAERELSYANVPYAVVLDEEGDLAGMITEVDIIEVARVVEGEAETGESLANEDDEWAWEGIKAVGNSYMPTRNVELPAGSVSQFMTEGLVTVSRRRSAREVAQLMIEHDIEQIPMLSGDQLIGIVTDMDLLEALE